MKPRPAGPDDWKSPEPAKDTPKKDKGSNKNVIIICSVLILSNAAWILFMLEQQRKFGIKISDLENKRNEPLAEKVTSDNNSNNI